MPEPEIMPTEGGRFERLADGTLVRLSPRPQGLEAVDAAADPLAGMSLGIPESDKASAEAEAGEEEHG